MEDNFIHKFTIQLEPRTKKNSQRIVNCGGYPRIIQSKTYLEYEKYACVFLKPLMIDYPVNIKSVFYMPTRRKVDISNLISALHDILVKYEVIIDDNYNIVYSIDGSRVFYDKQNPRTEIEITKINSEENNNVDKSNK